MWKYPGKTDQIHNMYNIQAGGGLNWEHYTNNLHNWQDYKINVVVVSHTTAPSSYLPLEVGISSKPSFVFKLSNHLNTMYMYANIGDTDGFGYYRIPCHRWHRMCMG